MGQDLSQAANAMTEETKSGSSSHPSQQQSNELRALDQALEQPPDKPSWTERADTFTETTLRTWLRICIFVLSALGLWVAVMLVSRPESISHTIRLIERIISSGRGFAIPALVLVTLLPRLLRLLLGRQDQADPRGLFEPPPP